MTHPNGGTAEHMAKLDAIRRNVFAEVMAHQVTGQKLIVCTQQRDRALKWLRKTGRIRFQGTPKRWTIQHTYRNGFDGAEATK